MKNSWCQHWVQTEHTPPITWPPLEFYFTRPVFLLCLWSRLFVSRSSASKLPLSLSRRKSLCWESESLSEWLADGVSEPWLAGDDDLEGDSKNFLIEGWLRIGASHDLVPCNKEVRQIQSLFTSSSDKSCARKVNAWRKSKYLNSCPRTKTHAAEDKSSSGFYKNTTANLICFFTPFDLRNPPGFGKENCSLLKYLFKVPLKITSSFLCRYPRSFTIHRNTTNASSSSVLILAGSPVNAYEASYRLAPCLLPKLNRE